jgi:hypothetical protein
VKNSDKRKYFILCITSHLLNITLLQQHPTLILSLARNHRAMSRKMAEDAFSKVTSIGTIMTYLKSPKNEQISAAGNPLDTSCGKFSGEHYQNIPEEKEPADLGMERARTPSITSTKPALWMVFPFPPYLLGDRKLTG